MVYLLDHEAGSDLVEELVIVLALGPLVLARDLHHLVDGLRAEQEMRVVSSQVLFAQLTAECLSGVALWLERLNHELCSAQQLCSTENT